MATMLRMKRTTAPSDVGCEKKEGRAPAAKLSELREVHAAAVMAHGLPVPSLAEQRVPAKSADPRSKRIESRSRQVAGIERHGVRQKGKPRFRVWGLG